MTDAGENSERETSFSFLLESVLTDVGNCEFTEGELSPLPSGDRMEALVASAHRIIDSYVPVNDNKEETINKEEEEKEIKKEHKEDVTSVNLDLQEEKPKISSITIKVPTPRERVRKMPTRPPPQAPKRVSRIKSDSEVKKQGYFIPRHGDLNLLNDEVRLERSHSVPGQDKPERILLFPFSQ